MPTGSKATLPVSVVSVLHCAGNALNRLPAVGVKHTGAGAQTSAGCDT
jgi:hypothetical protein